MVVRGLKKPRELTLERHYKLVTETTLYEIARTFERIERE